jgi:hypothetical protein
MKALILLSFLSLISCDGPKIRQELADCELRTRAVLQDGDYDRGFVIQCMQAKGFVVDRDIKLSQSQYCWDPIKPDLNASCYRRDDWFSEQLSHL